MIRSWRSDDAREVFEGRTPRRFPPDLIARTRRMLARLDAAATVEDMRAPPGNRLHALTGDRAGEWSVSVNDQYRITFKWGPLGPEDVWFGDYH